MDKIYEEMMENYCRMYLNSEEGQKTMLLSMAGVLNQKNIEVSNEFLNSSTVGYKCVLRDMKYVSEKIQEIIDLHKYISLDDCEIICNTIMKVSKILDGYKSKPVLDVNADKECNIIYENIALLGVKKRGMSIEEFLELAEIEEPQKTYESQYNPPERAQESQLIKYGYSVSQNSHLSNKARQDLLRRIINSKEVSKGYIISHLKHLIAINGKKESNYIALEKWKSDLEYVMKL